MSKHAVLWSMLVAAIVIIGFLGLFTGAFNANSGGSGTGIDPRFPVASVEGECLIGDSSDEWTNHLCPRNPNLVLTIYKYAAAEPNSPGRSGSVDISHDPTSPIQYVLHSPDTWHEDPPALVEDQTLWAVRSHGINLNTTEDVVTPMWGNVFEAGGTGPAGATGAQGPPGVPGGDGSRGATWFTGQGNPNGQTITGAQALDLYIDIDTGDYYEATNPTTWVKEGSLRGPQGIAGTSPEAVDALNKLVDDGILTFTTEWRNLTQSDLTAGYGIQNWAGNADPGLSGTYKASFTSGGASWTIRVRIPAADIPDNIRVCFNCELNNRNIFNRWSTTEASHSDDYKWYQFTHGTSGGVHRLQRNVRIYHLAAQTQINGLDYSLDTYAIGLSDLNFLSIDSWSDTSVCVGIHVRCISRQISICYTSTIGIS